MPRRRNPGGPVDKLTFSMPRGLRERIETRRLDLKYISVSAYLVFLVEEDLSIQSDHVRSTHLAASMPSTPVESTEKPLLAPPVEPHEKVKAGGKKTPGNGTKSGTKPK